jgi:hypothetical protein
LLGAASSYVCISDVDFDSIDRTLLHLKFAFLEVR